MPRRTPHTPGDSTPGRPSPDRLVVDIPHVREHIDHVEEWLLGSLDKHGYHDSARFAVRLALEEALANAFKHGHKTLPPETTVHVDLTVGPAEVRMVIEDQGPGFKPAAVPDPTLEENLEIPAGRGLLLMRAYMAEVEYEGRGNRVRMVYKPSPAAASA